MAVTDDLAWIQDTSSVSPLFGGNKVYFIVDTVERNGANIVASNPRILKDLSILTGESRATRWNRLKEDVAHSGMEAREWTLSGPIHEPDETLFNVPTTSFVTSDTFAKYDFIVDSEFSSDTTVTPTRTVLPTLSINRLLTLETFPRTLYLYDPFIIRQLIRGGSSNTTNFVYAHYTTTGVPVVISNVSITTNREGATNYTISFLEDKELT